MRQAHIDLEPRKFFSFWLSSFNRFFILVFDIEISMQNDQEVSIFYELEDEITNYVTVS